MARVASVCRPHIAYGVPWSASLPLMVIIPVAMTPFTFLHLVMLTCQAQ